MNWREDEAFVAALVEHRYVARRDGELELVLAPLVYDYMHNLWLDGIAYATPEPEEGAEPLEPTPHVIERARRLQALAMDGAAAPQERLNAWLAFEKIWKRYKLPVDFGISE